MPMCRQYDLGRRCELPAAPGSPYCPLHDATRPVPPPLATVDRFDDAPDFGTDMEYVDWALARSAAAATNPLDTPSPTQSRTPSGTASQPHRKPLANPTLAPRESTARRASSRETALPKKGAVGRSSVVLCSATTRSGNPCRFVARRESGLCINHDPAYAARQRENTLTGARASLDKRHEIAAQRAEVEHRLLAPDPISLDDRAGVQAVVEAVLRLEITGGLSTTRARNAIRLLSIAVRNFDRPVVQRSGTVYATSHHDPDSFELRRQALNRLLNTPTPTQP